MGAITSAVTADVFRDTRAIQASWQWGLTLMFSFTCLLRARLQFCIALVHVAIKTVFAGQESTETLTESPDAARQKNIVSLGQRNQRWSSSFDQVRNTQLPLGQDADGAAGNSARAASSLLRYPRCRASWCSTWSSAALSHKIWNCGSSGNLLLFTLTSHFL